MINGKLVGLRAVERTDLPLLRDWRNIPEFRKNFREYRELSLENQELWLKSITDNPKNYMFVIQRLSDQKPIGAAGLLYVDWLARYADFSFYIGENQAYIDTEGYAADAAQLLIQYAFDTLNLNKVWMELYEFDLKKIEFFTTQFNFKQDALLRQNCFADGRYWDSWIISLLRSEYDPSNKPKI
jgi:RimJ/RimL family protein N-acetyltransferase